MHSISTNQRLEPSDLIFCRIANQHHKIVKKRRQHRKKQFEAKIYRIAKRALTFGGFLLFALCLWMLR